MTRTADLRHSGAGTGPPVLEATMAYVAEKATRPMSSSAAHPRPCFQPHDSSGCMRGFNMYQRLPAAEEGLQKCPVS